jgi:hypothetical protein
LLHGHEPKPPTPKAQDFFFFLLHPCAVSTTIGCGRSQQTEKVWVQRVGSMQVPKKKKKKTVWVVWVVSNWSDVFTYGLSNLVNKGCKNRLGVGIGKQMLQVAGTLCIKQDGVAGSKCTSRTAI